MGNGKEMGKRNGGIPARELAKKKTCLELANPLEKSHEVKNAANGFCIAQRSALDHLLRLLQREYSRSDLFVFLRLSGALRESFRREDPHPLVHKAGSGNDAH